MGGNLWAGCIRATVLHASFCASTGCKTCERCDSHCIDLPGQINICKESHDPLQLRRTLSMPGCLMCSGEPSTPPSPAWRCAWPSTTPHPTTPTASLRAGEDCRSLLWEASGLSITQPSSLPYLSICFRELLPYERAGSLRLLASSTSEGWRGCAAQTAPSDMSLTGLPMRACSASCGPQSG